MNEFLMFLSQHWQVLTEIGLFLIVTLITIFRKKVKIVDVIKTIILDVLPEAICEAEKRFGSGQGSVKKKFVLGCVAGYLFKYFGINETDFNKYYATFVEEQLEKILDTPQKK